MTHPYGAHWPQPPTSSILLDEKHALMTEATFKELSEYSTSFPTGVYEGKMWRRNEGVFARDGKWLLCWFGPSDDPDKCSINSRVILLA